MLIAGWMLVSIGAWLCISGVTLLVRVTVLRVEAGIALMAGWRKPLRFFRNKRRLLGPVTWEALESSDKKRMAGEATALATESVAFFAASAFLVSVGGVLICMGQIS